MMKNRVKRILSRVGSLTCALLLLISLAGCGKAVSVPFWNRVMTIGNLDVSYDFLRYFVMNSIYNSDDVDPDKLAEDEAMQERVQENVYYMLRLLAAYISLADEYKITLESSDKSDIQATIKSIKDGYSKAEYKEALAESYMTEDVLYQLYVIDALKSKVYDYLINEYTSPIKSDDETIRQDIADGNWYYAEYISVTFGSDEADDKREQLVKEMWDRAKAGEPMVKLAEEYRKIFGLGDVIYKDVGGFTYGQMKQYFEDTVVSLEIGGYSELCSFPVADGYYVAHRLPLNEDYITDKFNEIFRAGYLERKIAELADARAAELEVKFQSRYEDLEFWTME